MPKRSGSGGLEARTRRISEMLVVNIAAAAIAIATLFQILCVLMCFSCCCIEFRSQLVTREVSARDTSRNRNVILAANEVLACSRPFFIHTVASARSNCTASKQQAGKLHLIPTLTQTSGVSSCIHLYLANQNHALNVSSTMKIIVATAGPATSCRESRKRLST